MQVFDYKRKPLVTMTVAEFHDALRKQGVTSREEWKFRCPRCGTVQTAQDLIDAGAGDDFEAVEKYLAFSCVGRWDDNKGCDWTLGGPLQIQELNVVVDDEFHPRMMPV